MIYSKLSLSTKIMIAMALGAVAGLILGPHASKISVVGDIFLRLLRMAVVPMIFINVLLAVAGIGDIQRLGKLSSKMLVIFAVTSFIAAIIGLISALLIRPGAGFVMENLAEVAPASPLTLNSLILNFFPVNIMQSLAEGNMLQIITFAIFSGIAVLLLKDEDRTRAMDIFGLLQRLIMKILTFAIKFAPFGVFALMANSVARYGIDIFRTMGWFILAIYAGALFHAFVVYGTMYYGATRKSLFAFYKTITPIWTTSIATCSSQATLPVSMQTCEEVVGLRKDIVRFTLPIGATINMDGNALWYGVVVAFVSQVIGVQMSIPEMVFAVALGVLMTVGSPGIPGGIFVATTVFLTTLGLPLEFIGLLAGFIRTVDMGLTTLNVLGDVFVAVVLDAGERKKDKKESAA